MHSSVKGAILPLPLPLRNEQRAYSSPTGYPLLLLVLLSVLPGTFCSACVTAARSGACELGALGSDGVTMGPPGRPVCNSEEEAAEVGVGFEPIDPEYRVEVDEPV